jgi:hypothetical protein
MRETVRTTTISGDTLIRFLSQLVLELDLDPHDFVIFGSGPLLAHGLRRSLSDLDVVARGATWHRVAERGEPGIGAISGAPMALFRGGRIQFSRGWVSPEWDADDLIERAEIIQGLPFAQLKDVLAYKQELARPKDRRDVVALLKLLPSTDAAYRPAPSLGKPARVSCRFLPLHDLQYLGGIRFTS